MPTACGSPDAEIVRGASCHRTRVSARAGARDLARMLAGGRKPDPGRPKYVQLADDVVAGVRTGRLRGGDRLPSLNEASAELGVARATVVRAYLRLAHLRFVTPVHGKGFYVRRDAEGPRPRALVVLDVLANWRAELFDALAAAADDRAEVDLRLHRGDGKRCARLLTEAIDRYDRYLVMPAPGALANEALAHLTAHPSCRVLLLPECHAVDGGRALGERAACFVLDEPTPLTF